jgi:hypothetical protein
MRTRRTKEQIRKDNYNKDVDAYNFYVVNLDTMRAETGFEFREDAVDLLNDYDDKKKYKVVSKRALKSMGIENPNESFKYEGGGDFQSGVYAKGGGLDSHGIKQGDTFLKTLSGGIQKVKDKNGNIFYINLATGERSATIPLPFDDGGEVKYFLNKDGIRVRSVAKPEKKLSEREWMAKHNESKEARSYAFGGFFGKSDMMSRPKHVDLDDKQVRLKSGEYVQVLDQDGSSLMVMEVSKLGTGATPKMVTIADVDMTSFAGGGEVLYVDNFELDKDKIKNAKYLIQYNRGQYTIIDNKTKKAISVFPTQISAVNHIKTKLNNYANGGGVGLIGNQKRIDMNHNGKIDAEDFKLLRSSMNGAWRKEHKYVNSTSRKDGKVIDYEVRYARKNNPSRKGYKGKTFATGGGISNFERLSKVVAKNYEGKRVKPQYQKEYGKVYSKEEAKEVGNKVAGKVKANQKMSTGGATKKGGQGAIMILAKKIRKDGEKWTDAVKRAGQQLK